MRFLLTLLCLIVLVTGRVRAQRPSQAQIDQIVKEAVDHFQVPGAAIAIVQDDLLVYMNGFGVKEIGKPGAVTTDTVFPLASCSKAFTATLLAMLVDEGKLTWDDPVRKHLPWFKLADPAADTNVTIRDLLTHRTGLGKHEALWYRTPLSMEERARRLAFLEPHHSFRSTFEYQVIAYGTAGLAGASAGGAPWEKLLQDRLLKPLDMKNANPAFPGNGKADLASPHKRGPKGIQVIERYPLTDPDPAGSVHASVRDLSRFLRLQLSGGTWQHRRLVSEGALRETQSPQIVIPLEGFARVMNPDSHVLSYTLTWISQDYRGKWMLIHGGTVDGFRAQLTLVPDLRLGIAIVNNLDRSWMNYALTHTLVDRFANLPPKDWNDYVDGAAKEMQRLNKARLQEMLASRKPNTKPSLPLESYAGSYFDKAFGRITIRVANGTLQWQWGAMHSRLEHFHFDTFLSAEEPLDNLVFLFQLNADGEVDLVRAMDREFVRER